MGLGGRGGQWEEVEESKRVHMYETRKNKEKFKVCENHESIYWKNGLLTYTFLF